MALSGIMMTSDLQQDHDAGILAILGKADVTTALHISASGDDADAASHDGGASDGDDASGDGGASEPL